MTDREILKHPVFKEWRNEIIEMAYGIGYSLSPPERIDFNNSFVMDFVNSEKEFSLSVPMEKLEAMIEAKKEKEE